jgi:hypothetical protein
LGKKILVATIYFGKRIELLACAIPAKTIQQSHGEFHCATELF